VAAGFSVSAACRRQKSITLITSLLNSSGCSRYVKGPLSTVFSLIPNRSR
jgi:hypothetical protein